MVCIHIYIYMQVLHSLHCLHPQTPDVSRAPVDMHTLQHDVLATIWVSLSTTPSEGHKFFMRFQAAVELLSNALGAGAGKRCAPAVLR